jgi:hypothetical protein
MFERHRDKSGQMSKKHGNTLVRTLRRHYGADWADNEKLSDVLRRSVLTAPSAAARRPLGL